MRTILFIGVILLIIVMIIGFINSRPPKAAKLKSEEKNELLSLRQMKDNIQLGVGEAAGEHAVSIVLDEIRQHHSRMRELNN